MTMNIASPKWMTAEKLCLSVTIDGKHMAVPADENNTHYAAILEWVADGNVIQEAED
jgi:hypothetical protein